MLGGYIGISSRDISEPLEKSWSVVLKDKALKVGFCVGGPTKTRFNTEHKVSMVTHQIRYADKYHMHIP